MLQKILSILVVIIYLAYSGINYYTNKHIDINNEGVELHNTLNYTGALEKYNEALEIKPKSSLYNYNKATVLFDLGDYNRALIFLDNAINYYDSEDSNPANYDSKEDILELSEIYSYRGATYYNLDLLDDATKDLDKALKLNPNDLGGLYYDSLIKTYDEYYDYSGSLDLINKYISIQKSDPDGYYLKGDIYYYYNNFSGAIDNYQKTVKIDPTYDYTFYLIGHSYARLSNYKKAYDNYKKAYELDNKYYIYSFYVGYSLYYLNNFEESKKYLEESLELEGGEDDEAIKLYNLLIINKLDGKEKTEKFLKDYFGVGPYKLDSILSLERVFIDEGYDELKYRISKIKE